MVCRQLDVFAPGSPSHCISTSYPNLYHSLKTAFYEYLFIVEPLGAMSSKDQTAPYGTLASSIPTTAEGLTCLTVAKASLASGVSMAAMAVEASRDNPSVAPCIFAAAKKQKELLEDTCQRDDDEYSELFNMTK